MAGDTGQYWDPLVMQQELSPQEKLLRDRFVAQYLIDHDAYLAAIRVGYVQNIASQYAAFLINDPYVQREIARLKQTVPPTPVEVKAQRKQNQYKLERLLWELAYVGTPASRVAAASKLCNIYDMDGTTKIKSEVTHKGGVMLVPGIAKLEDWEKQAAQQQDKLIEGSAEDRTGKPVH